MRWISLLVAAILVATVAAAPNTCRRGRKCRTRGGTTTDTTTIPTTTSTDTTTTDTTTTSASLSSTTRPLKKPSLRRPVKGQEAVAEAAAAKEVTDGVTEEATKDVTEEIRRVGVNGWLAAPTAAPLKSRTSPPRKADRPGHCETPKGFGIKCKSGTDQCKYDDQCPNSTKCCMVDQCGRLCVTPKPTSDEAKEPTKDGEKTGAKKNKEEEKKEVEVNEGGGDKVSEKGGNGESREAVDTKAVTSEAPFEPVREVSKKTEENVAVKDKTVKTVDSKKKEGTEENTPRETSTAAMTEDSAVDEVTNRSTEA
ncbi:probable serine/threonine-protein kinase DDB_G0275165 [Procambarus clarkii]|uniref:probable serine/threonine-protein kinase DDB_G0275165 n=1 Tax=Procambarus clarkii TaxID=6728 RepID=UPI003744233C